MSIKVLGLNWSDGIGSRFNGLSITKALGDLDVEYKLFAGKVHLGGHVNSLGKEFVEKNSTAHARVSKIESRLGLQSKLFWTTREIFQTKEYVEADLIHLHILHNGWFRLEEVLRIKKPIVWTIHDLWITTGHCIAPGECEMWKRNCLKCPDLARPMSVERDRARFEVKRKEKILQELDARYIVSTNWSKEQLIEKYPFIESRLKVIPFGIDQSKFFPKWKERGNLRKKLGISEDTMVILIRASTDPQKNLQFAKFAIGALKRKGKFHIFTLEQMNHFSTSEFSDLTCTDFGWILEEDKLADIYSAADIFLMPSTSETFGMMALEAMACGTTVVYQRETAVDSVVNADTRLTFRKNARPIELTTILEDIQTDPKCLALESERVRLRAVTEFSIEKYAFNVASHYKDVLKL